MGEQTPAPGDLLISRRPSDDHFEISVVPGRAQVAVRQQHEAVKQAKTYAATNGGRVWLRHGNTYTLMGGPISRRKES